MAHIAGAALTAVILFVCVVWIVMDARAKRELFATTVDALSPSGNGMMCQDKVSGMLRHCGGGVSLPKINVEGKLFFGDTSMSTGGKAENNTDPYYVEKVVDAGTKKSSLRVTLNDDPDESLQIWGNSCKSPGGCGGAGAQQHVFRADGYASHAGNVNVAGALNVGTRLHFADGSMSTSGNATNGTDSYYLEKVVAGANQSSLRLSLNDDNDESFQIWGRGAQKHVFRADGAASHAGSVNLAGNVNVGGKLFFGDASMSTGGNATNGTDSYYLEKVVASPNNSALRLTLNDDNDESLQIWGRGAQKHAFRADGQASHAGNVAVGGTLSAANGKLTVDANGNVKIVGTLKVCNAAGVCRTL